MKCTVWDVLPDELQCSLQYLEPQLSRIKMTGLTADSRQVSAGVLFLATPGTHLDGRDFIQQAKQRGAAFVLAQAHFNLDQDDVFPQDIVEGVLFVQNLNQWVGEIAAAFYGYPSRNLKLIGVTGTNGKTTTAFLLASMAQALGLKSAVLGTNGFGCLDALQPQLLTTPGPIELQAQLAQLRDDNVELLAMEVSSHALDQQRVKGCEFDVGVFTNLSRDHLDYHGDFAAYAAAKQKLFTQPGLECAVVNIDDKYGERFLQQSFALNKWSYGQALSVACLSGVPVNNFQGAAFTVVKSMTASTLLEIVLGGETIQLTTELVGVFNFYNLLASIIVMHQLGFSLAEIQRAASFVKLPEGRMQRVDVQSNQKDMPYVIVDFAHTPDAIQVVLHALQVFVKERGGRLIALFGCGGDRDRGKRAMMAEVVQQNSDLVYLTSDNPRSEAIEKIFEDIKLGFVVSGTPVIEVVSRAQAITQSIKFAAAKDVVVLLGKGHEKYQEIAGIRQPFDDFAIAKQALLQWCNEQSEKFKS